MMEFLSFPQTAMPFTPLHLEQARFLREMLPQPLTLLFRALRMHLTGQKVSAQKGSKAFVTTIAEVNHFFPHAYSAFSSALVTIRTIGCYN